MCEAVLTDEERYVDACVLGTGLTESLIAASLARHGKRVLHLDRADSYGGNWRALSLAEMEKWANVPPPPPPPPPPPHPPAPATTDDVDETAGQDKPEESQAGDANAEARVTLEASAVEASAPAPVTVAGSSQVDIVGEATPFVPPPPDRDVSHLEAVPLEPEETDSCYTRRGGSWDPFGARTVEEQNEVRKQLLKRGASQWSIDLVPRLLFGRSDTVDALVESGVARYLEFQGLKSARVLTPKGLASVPLTKSDIFQDATLTLPEKRMLMKFITSMSPIAGSLAFESPAQLGVDQARKVAGPADPSHATSGALEGVDVSLPWSQFLQKQKLSARLQEFITYAICLWDWEPGAAGNSVTEELSTGEGLRCLGRFVSSLGLYGRGTAMPLIYPMYGAAEVAQGYTRMCALHRGTYALRTWITQILVSRETKPSGDANAESAANEGSPEVAAVVTNRGEVIWTRGVISSCDHFAQKSAKVQGSSCRHVCKRMTVLADCPLLSEEGLNLCVVPPSAMEPRLDNVVQVLQLDFTTGTCPRGYYIIHLSQTSRTSPSEADEDAATFADLTRVLQALLRFVEDGPRRCLFSCRYLHAPRALSRWDATTAGGRILNSCARDPSKGGLLLCADPTAAPQLLMADEVAQAKEAFLKTAMLKGPLRPKTAEDTDDDAKAEGEDDGAGGVSTSEETAVRPEDFLRKPVHVAQEEMASGMEELEHFNEQMMNAEQQAQAPATLNPQSAAEMAENEGPIVSPVQDGVETTTNEESVAADPQPVSQSEEMPAQTAASAQA